MTGTQTNRSIEFSFEIAWTRNYSGLFQNTFFENTPIDGILDKARKSGRIMLCGKGGSGKTTIAVRLCENARREGYSAVFVKMRNWTRTLQEMWDQFDEHPISRANFLLSNLGEPSNGLPSLDSLEPNRPKLIVFDGLNEVHLRTGGEIIVAADWLAGAFMNISVITTDRLVRRDINQDRWSLGMVLPLKDEEVRELLTKAIARNAWEKLTDRQQHMLESPFFLDKVLKTHKIPPTSAEVIGDYLREHATLSEQALDALARGAFATYGAGFSGRSFPKEALLKGSEADAVRRLEEAGFLAGADDTVYFDHHLVHDYLAARYLAVHSEKWEEKAFDAISFNASSFDAIAKVLEQLDSNRADEFIRRVYDWNPYAAAYAISDTASSERRVSEEMEVVITAMLAERRWDLILPTVTRAEDALAIISTELAIRYLGAGTMEEVLKMVGDQHSDAEWFLIWKQLFTRRPHQAAMDSDIQLLSSADSILGWTMANKLRRLDINEQQSVSVRDLAANAASGAVRWRAVHVLGAFPSRENWKSLFARFEEDQYEWVRYGALRSLMENAAKSQALRSEVLGALSEKAGLLMSSARLRNEFYRASFAEIVGEDGKRWIAELGRVVRSLADHSRDEKDLELWARLSRELDKRYAA